jgi:hypothetical protein
LTLRLLESPSWRRATWAPRFNVTAEQQGKVLRQVLTVSFREPNDTEKTLENAKDKALEVYNYIKESPYLIMGVIALVVIAIIGFFMLIQREDNKKSA